MVNSTSKRVLFVNPLSYGGNAHYAHEFCSALVDLGHRVTILCAGSFEVPRELRNYEVVEAPEGWGWGKARTASSRAVAFWVAAWTTYSRRIDVAFLNVYHPVMSWPFALLKPRGVPVFCIQHEVEPRVGRKRISWFQRDFYRRTTAMLVHRHTPARDLLVRKYGVVAPVITIDHGIWETDLFGRAAAGTSEVKSSILSFGIVREDKGLDVLVDAFPGKEACGGLDLVIAGEAKGDYGRYFERLIVGRSDIVWKRRYISDKETGLLFRDAAFAVLPFRECTQSGSLRLAMFFDTPVVATDVGEIPGFIERHRVGELVPRGDVKALSGAISRLANDPGLRARYVENIQQLKRGKELAWSVIVARLVSELEERHLW